MWRGWGPCPRVPGSVFTVPQLLPGFSLPEGENMTPSGASTWVEPPELLGGGNLLFKQGT